MMDNYAIYRLPECTECTLLAQTQGEPEEVDSVAELNGKEGFLMVPFEPSKEHPVLLLKPDVVKKFTIAEKAEVCENEITEIDSKNSREFYHNDFEKFHSAIKEGAFSKLVLSRRSHLKSENTVKAMELFEKACRIYPHQYIALISTRKSGTWLMATPELLLGGNGNTWHTMALAGTMKMKEGEQISMDEPVEDRWTEKNIQEQQYVTTYIEDILKKHSSKIEQKGPYTTMAAQLLHLRTDFEFSLDDKQHLGNLLEDLYPTPAVCGMPKDKARNFILQNESEDRKYYSGFCGTINPEGESHLYVSLRCMEIGENEYTLYAGGGLLKESQEESEWLETEAKLHTMKRVIID